MNNSILFAIVVGIIACINIIDTHASLAHLQHKIAAASEEVVSSPVDVTTVRSLQAQVGSVTQTLDSFLNQHSKETEAAQFDHQQISQILETLTQLTNQQKEIEERNQRQIAADHENLLQLIATQKKQQALLTQELEHSKNLELQLAQLKQEQEQQANQHMAAQELAHSTALMEENHRPNVMMGQDSMMDDIEGSLIETSSAQQTHHAAGDNTHGMHALHNDPWSHLEHDVDLSHTMNHGEESALELQERAMGLAAAAGSHHLPDPSRYSSSADYLTAMDSVDSAMNMSPDQLRSFGEHIGAGPNREVGTPSSPRGVHSLSEIDNLVAAGEHEHQQSQFEFHPDMLHNPRLKSELSNLQDEDSIQRAMLKAQARIRAIAAELAKHQSQLGADHSEGIEIELGVDEPSMHY